MIAGLVHDLARNRVWGYLRYAAHLYDYYLRTEPARVPAAA